MKVSESKEKCFGPWDSELGGEERLARGLKCRQSFRGFSTQKGMECCKVGLEAGRGAEYGTFKFLFLSHFPSSPF